jgi:hypothetical protein
MAKRMNRGRSSESSARSRRSRGGRFGTARSPRCRACGSGQRPGTDAPFSCTRHETTEMMTISEGSRGDAGAPKQTAARVSPPTLIVPTMSVAWRACSAPSASRARASTFPSPGPASYFAVASAANWPGATPVGVVATSPGTGHRLMEIVSPDRDRHQLAGGRRPMPARPGLRQASSGPDHEPARPGWNRRQATELIPS